MSCTWNAVQNDIDCEIQHVHNHNPLSVTNSHSDYFLGIRTNGLENGLRDLYGKCDAFITIRLLHGRYLRIIVIGNIVLYRMDSKYLWASGLM